MSEQAEIQTPEPPEEPPFQFSLKHLLAAPIVLALFLSTATFDSCRVASWRKTCGPC